MSFAMNNFEFDVTAIHREGFELIMQFVAIEHPYAVAWSIDPKEGLLLYWAMSDSMKTSVQTLPYKMKGKTLIDFAWSYLVETEITERHPDIDGSCSKGWRVHNTGITGGWSYAYIAIKPIWALHGK